MNMTMEQYIQNPVGKNSAVLPAIMREAFYKNYSERFNNIMLRENGNIEYHKYTTKNNEYILHIKIPSEEIKKFYYDVVIKFYADASILNLGRSLSNYYFKVYSNDPAFVYTHCFVFNKNELFIDELKSKMVKEALTKAPTEKNPNEQLTYCKSIFFAYLFIKNRGLFNKLAWKDATTLSFNDLKKVIMHADEKIAKRQEEGAKVEKRKKIIVDQKTAKTILHNKNLSDEAKARIVTTSKISTNSLISKKTKTVNSIGAKKSNRK